MYMTEPVLHILRTDDFVGGTEKTVQPAGLIRNGERKNVPGSTVRRPKPCWRRWRGCRWPERFLTNDTCTNIPQSLISREQYNGLLFALLRVQKGTQCNRFLVPRYDVNDL